jgi:RNA polymerase sigma-70 factor (ECF subfamily)
MYRPGVETVPTTSAYLENCDSSERRQARNYQCVITLYDHLRPSLHKYLRSLGLSKDHAEDVMQEVFLRLLRHFVEQGTDENLRAWLFRVAHNLSMDFHRSEWRWFRYKETEPDPVLRERVDRAPNPEQKITLEERKRQFEDAFARLTPKQRHCVTLRAAGMRYRAIAQAMGVSHQRVGELMKRAIALLNAGT